MDNKQLEKHGSVMVIDDAFVDRFIAEKLISRLFLTESVILKESAIDALAYLDTIINFEEVPKIIFLDIRMPDMDGFEFLDKFKKYPYDLRYKTQIIMLTSSTNIDDQNKANSYDFVKGYLIKPLSETVLKNKLSELNIS